jgi:predicted transposase YdaD
MDDAIHHPHDKLFKTSFSDPATAEAFLKWQLSPGLAAKVNWSTLKLEPGSFIDDRFRQSESDLLFSAAFLPGNNPNGDGENDGGPKDDTCYFYILLEHISSPVAWLSLKLLGYMVRIWQDLLMRPSTGEQSVKPKHLPLVLPFVVAQNDERWELAQTFSELFQIPEGLDQCLRPFIPEFRFLLLQLAEVPYRAIAGTPAGILALRVLKADRQGELLGDDVWDETVLDHVARDFFEMVLRYLMRGCIDTPAFESRLQKVINPQLKSTAMTLAEQYVEKGLQKGLQEGRQEGVQKGIQSSILDALEVRFGTVPEGLKEAVETVTDEAKLHSLLRSAVTAASVEAFAQAL